MPHIQLQNFELKKKKKLYSEKKIRLKSDLRLKTVKKLQLAEANSS